MLKRLLPTNLLTKSSRRLHPSVSCSGALRYFASGKSVAEPQLQSVGHVKATDSLFSTSTTMKRLQESLAAAGQRLNDATGYSSIEAQKRRIEEQESIVFTAIERVSQAKDQYDASIKLRSNSQREVNELLQRKSTWIQSDLERFTTLFRSDHSNALKEEECKASLEQAELDLEKVRSKLSTMILTRYHEEQIWSDKIRRVSTWGTWALMGINIILFVFVQLALEPWKRQRLVARFEDRLRQVVQEERTLTNLLPSSEVSQNSESPAEAEVFLTAADQQGQYDPMFNQRAAEEAEFLTDADSAAQGFDHSISMAPTSRDQDADMYVALVSKARYWLQMLTIHGKSLAPEIWRKTCNAVAFAFSSHPSSIPMEDITSACLASAALGIAVGLMAAEK